MLKAWATQLGMNDVAKLLDATLQEEKKADALLTQIAEKAANRVPKLEKAGRQKPHNWKLARPSVSLGRARLGLSPAYRAGQLLTDPSALNFVPPFSVTPPILGATILTVRHGG